MNKEELIKMFDEEFGCIIGNQTEIDQINDFIFETIIPEVLKNIIPEENNGSYVLYDSGWNDCIHGNNGIKQKAKSLYGIEL